MSKNYIKILPKDVIWIILKYVISDFYVTNKIKFFCCSKKGKIANPEEGKPCNPAQLMIDLASVSNEWNEVLKSKCYWHGCGWSFKKDGNFHPNEY
jgi:hypothetical protein